MRLLSILRWLLAFELVQTRLKTETSAFIDRQQGGTMYLPRSNEEPIQPATLLFKRETGIGSGIIMIALVGGVLVTVFIPLFVFMYQSWKWEKTARMKAQQVLSPEEGGQTLGKAELPAGASATIHEMDNAQDARELSETKDGLPHELPGATSFPQELPAALHEMPACDGNCILNKKTSPG